MGDLNTLAREGRPSTPAFHTVCFAAASNISFLDQLCRNSRSAAHSDHLLSSLAVLSNCEQLQSITSIMCSQVLQLLQQQQPWLSSSITGENGSSGSTPPVCCCGARRWQQSQQALQMRLSLCHSQD
jgi:hypothetical protein